MEAEFYNIKTKLYLGLFLVKTLVMPSFALDTTLHSSLGLLHGRKRAHCVSVPIFNKKFHGTRAVENFETFHSSCPMIFFVENRHTKSQGHKKNAHILYVGESAPAPPTQLEIRMR